MRADAVVAVAALLAVAVAAVAMPRRNPLPIPRVVRSGRVVRRHLLQRVGSLVKGGVIPRPLWFDAMLAHPPPPPLRLPKPHKITFAEDDLRRTWLRRNPAATMRPKALFVEDDALPPGARDHPADAFAARQMELMERGYPREEAYRKVQREERERERARALEAEEARQQAVALGAASAAAPPADSGADAKARLQQQLLRRFAEEARDAGLAYPKRWFAADGSWIGIKTAPASGAATVREALSPEAPEDAALRALLDDVDIAAVSEAAAAEPTDATKSVPEPDGDGNPPSGWGSC